MSKLTSLGRAVVLARGGCTWARTTSLLDAECPALVNLALQTLLGGVSLVRRHHLDEAEAARLLGVRVAHDVALLDLAVLLKETCDLLLAERGVDAGDEQVGARVAALVVLLPALWGWATGAVSRCRHQASTQRHTGYRVQCRVH